MQQSAALHAVHGKLAPEVLKLPAGTPVHSVKLEALFQSPLEHLLALAAEFDLQTLWNKVSLELHTAGHQTLCPSEVTAPPAGSASLLHLQSGGDGTSMAGLSHSDKPAAELRKSRKAHTPAQGCVACLRCTSAMQPALHADLGSTAAPTRPSTVPLGKGHARADTMSKT